MHTSAAAADVLIYILLKLYAHVWHDITCSTIYTHSSALNDTTVQVLGADDCHVVNIIISYYYDLDFNALKNMKNENKIYCTLKKKAKKDCKY